MVFVEWFASDGLILPIAIMVTGGWMIHFGPKRAKLSADQISSLPRLLQHMARLKIEKPVGIFMVISGLLIGLLRLGSLVST